MTALKGGRRRRQGGYIATGNAP